MKSIRLKLSKMPFDFYIETHINHICMEWEKNIVYVNLLLLY